MYKESKSHSCCPNDEECHWPLNHHDLAKMKSDGTYQNVNLLQDYPKRIRQTRLAANDQTVRSTMDIYTDVQLRLQTLATRLNEDLKIKLFDEGTKDQIENIRSIADVASLAKEVKSKGAVVLAHQRGKEYVKTIRKLTVSLDDIGDSKLSETFEKFLLKLEAYAGESDTSIN